MADYEALKAELDAMSEQLNALESKLQIVNAESVEAMKAELKRLLDEHLAAYLHKAGVVASAPPRCAMRWRAGVLNDPDNPQPPNGARCVLPPHDKTTPCRFTGGPRPENCSCGCHTTNSGVTGHDCCARGWGP